MHVRWIVGRRYEKRAFVACGIAGDHLADDERRNSLAVHNLIDGSVHNAFHLKNAFPELNPPHTYARSLFFIVNSAFREIFA